jgi:hypothetical protein
MLNTVSQYIRDAKKNWRSGRWTGECTSALQRGQRPSAVIGRKFVLRREAIGFHRDVALISNVSHIQWMFLERILCVALEDRYQTTQCIQI